MSFETVDKIAERLFESPFISNEVTVVWHAGEPLAVPISFYEEASSIIQAHTPPDVQLVTSFQTNATLITEEWCDFFRRVNARIGVSLDGPRAVHDAYRVDRRGGGTFDKVVRGFSMLTAAGIRPSVIAVVTERALDVPEEFIGFFCDLGVEYLGLNPEELEGANTSSTIHHESMTTRYRDFFSRLLAASRTYPHPPIIREYDSFLRHVRSGRDETKGQDNIPIAIVSFDHLGNISTFSPELLTASHQTWGDFHFGNVFTHSLTDVLDNEKFVAMNREIRHGVSACRASCEYYLFCGGGSPSNKIAESGSFACTETMACRLRVKATVDAIVADFESNGTDYS